MMNFPMTPATKVIIDEAVGFAKRYNFAAIGTEALLYGLTCSKRSNAYTILREYNITSNRVLEAMSRFGFVHKSPVFDYSQNAGLVIKRAIEYSGQIGTSAVTPEQLLYSLLQTKNTSAQLILRSGLHVLPESIIEDLVPFVFPHGVNNNLHISNARRSRDRDFSSILDRTFEDLFGTFMGDPDDIIIESPIYKKQKQEQRQEPRTWDFSLEQDDPRAKPKDRQAASESKVKSNLPEELLEMGQDMTAKARGGKMDPIIGRDAETERVIEILCRKTKNNPVLIGEAGVGKSAVVEGLAQRIVKGDVPAEMKDKIIYSLDIGSLMAGTKYRGSMEEKLKGLIETIVKNKNIIVFIDEIHMLAQAGSKEGEISPSDMLKPYLARGEFQTIGATTNDEYRKFIEKDKALERRFQPVSVAEPSEEDCKKILKGIRPSFEKFHGVKISDEAISAAVDLSVRYIMDRYLPDKAIDLIDEASSRLKVKNVASSPEMDKLQKALEEALENKERAREKENYIQADEFKNQAEDIKAEMIALTDDLKAKGGKAGALVVTQEDIAAVVSKWTKIPVSKLTESEKEKLMNLESILSKRVIGQKEAIKYVSSAIRRARAGLKDPKRPIGSFIFLGPTGVGKTELTKALAEALFDDENMVIRLDMSEYMESHSVSRLIGAPPGYVGHDDGGQLTEQVRRHPYSVVLFDEIEKAHPDVFNILLQMLDDGRLTDSLGRTVSFKNTIIILTSNIGVSTLPKRKASIGFGDGDDTNVDVREHLMKALKAAFRPELLNRIDQTIIFDRLTEEDITKIAGIMIKKLEAKLAMKSISLVFTKGAMKEIFEKGYDPEYGARPLRRFIEQNVEDGLAEAILSGSVNDGDRVVVSFKNGKFHFETKNIEE